MENQHLYPLLASTLVLGISIGVAATLRYSNRWVQDNFELLECRMLAMLRILRAEMDPEISREEFEKIVDQEKAFIEMVEKDYGIS